MGAEQGLQALSITSQSRWLHLPTERFVPSEVCTNSRLTTLSLHNRKLVRQVCKDISSPPAVIKETSASHFNSFQNEYLPCGWTSICILPQMPFQNCSSPMWAQSNPGSCCVWGWKRQSSPFFSKLNFPSPAIQLYFDLPFPFLNCWVFLSCLIRF